MSQAQHHDCRNAARLLSERRDRRLQLGERLRLRAHLWVCVGCRRFERQLALLEAASQAWRRPASDAD